MSTTTIVSPTPILFDEARLAVAGFLTRYSGPTRTSYATDLRQFFSWCAQMDLQVFAVQRGHVELWARAMEDRGLARATVGRRLSTVAGFFRIAVLDGLLEHSPAEYVRPSEDPHRIGHAVTAALDAGVPLRDVQIAARQLRSQDDHTLRPCPEQSGPPCQLHRDRLRGRWELIGAMPDVGPKPTNGQRLWCHAGSRRIGIPEYRGSDGGSLPARRRTAPPHIGCASSLA